MSNPLYFVFICFYKINTVYTYLFYAYIYYMATLLLTGGGTAGHCTPNLAIIPYAEKFFDKIYYIGSEHGIEKNIIESAGIPYFSVPCAKLNRSLTLKNLSIPFKVLSGIHEAGKIIDKLNPDVVFSKGGYVSVPTVIAAHRRKIPVIAHESDYTVGLANKITSRYCKKVLTSFPHTAEELKNGQYVGSPLRKELFSTKKEEALKKFGFSGEKPIILITGGSQGAQAINQAVSEAIPELLPKFDIIHICGKNNSNGIKKKGYYQAEYLNDIENAFAAADVCVTRAGSNTLFELMSLKKPCVLIPLPKGVSRGDQILNARYFQKLGLSFLLTQDTLTTDSLIFAITSTYANRYNILRNFAKHPITDASSKIAEIIADYRR